MATVSRLTSIVTTGLPTAFRVPRRCATRSTNDCDGVVDNDATDAKTYYLDADGDGYGTDANTTIACTAPEGYRSRGGDCDDTTRAAHPDGTELCDGIDNDCVGGADLTVPGTWATLQAAADAAPAGVEVCLEARSYEERVHLNLKRQLHLVGVGSGPGDTVLDLGVATAQSSQVWVEGGAHLTLRNLRVAGADYRVEGSDRTSGLFAGVRTDGALTLDNVVFADHRVAVDSSVGHYSFVSNAGGTLTANDVVIDGLELHLASSGTSGRHAGGFFELRGDSALTGVSMRNVVVRNDPGTSICSVGPLFAAMTYGTTALRDVEIEGVDVALDCDEAAVFEGVAEIDGVEVDVAGVEIRDVQVELGAGAVASAKLWRMSEGVGTIDDLTLSNNELTLSGPGQTHVDGLLHLHANELLLTHVTAHGNRVSALSPRGEVRGGVVFAQEDRSTLRWLDARGNVATAEQTVDGGVLHLANNAGALVVENAILAGNTAGDGLPVVARGGAIFVDTADSGSVVLRQIDAVGNGARGQRAEGGAVAIYNDFGAVSVTNCSWVSNATEGSIEAFGSALYVFGHPGVSWSFNNAFGNVGAEGAFGGIDDIADLGSGQQSVDPEYVTLAGKDPVAWNVALQAGSPLVDAGDPKALDADGTRSDVGAYGGAEGGGW